MRVFAAVALPEGLQAEFAEMLRELKRRYPKAGRWSRIENLHFTLAFLGEVEPEEAQRAAATIEALEPAELSWEACGFGLFEHSGILWVRFLELHALEKLARSARSELKRTGFSFDEKPFKAHMTIARNWTGPEACDLDPSLLPSVRVESVQRAHLYQSDRDNQGRLRYRVVRVKGSMQ